MKTKLTLITLSSLLLSALPALCGDCCISFPKLCPPKLCPPKLPNWLGCCGDKPHCQFYLAGAAEMGWHNDTDINVTPATGASHRTGFGGTLALGYIFEHWRMELEGAYRRFRNSSVTVAGAPVTTNKRGFTDVALMANAIYDFRICNWPLNFYAGIGIGIASSDFRAGTYKLADPVFAWQGMIGIQKCIYDQWYITFGYRLFATSKISDNGQKTKDIPVTNSFNLGLRVYL